MNELYALQLAALRANRLGWTDYDHQPRTFVIAGRETITVDSNDQLHLLIEAPVGVSVESQTGYYDSTSLAVNEQTEEFTGRIQITNRTNVKTQIRFLQVVPRKKNKL